MAHPQARPVPALIALVLLAALAFATATSVSGAATGSKRLKCKGGKVLVKINKKQRCQPLRKVVPKPKRGDRTLINFRNGLVDVTTLKGRGGKRVKLPRRAAAGARVARKRFLRAIPKVIALMEARSQSASRRARARTAAVDCGGPGSAVTDGPPGSTDGLGLQGMQGPHGEEGGVLTTEVNGFRYEATFIKCGNKFYYVNGCPKSNGEAPSQAKGRFTVTQRILQGGRLIHSSSTDSTYEDKLLGKVEDTAKLKYFDFTRKEQSLTVATGGVVTGGTADRTVRVNMPSGSYDGRYTRVTINADPNTFKMQDLAASIEAAIKEYKEAENGGSFLHTYGWSTFDRPEGTYCAKAIFGPASEAITLQKNQAATVAIHAQGEDGGTATGARWTLIDTTNALFSPTSVTNPSPTINYTVSGSPVGDKVRMTAKFTSTAGVGKDKWTEPVKDLPTINHIEGTFSGAYKVPIPTLGGHSVVTWTGTARFDRSSPAIYGGASGLYFVGAGGYDLEASGYDGSGVTGCQQSGTKHVDFTPMSSGSFTVNGVDLGSYFNPPYNYGIQLAGVGPQTFMVTLHDCPAGAESMEGKQVPLIYFPPALDTGDAVVVSDDGTRYQGERHQNVMGVTTDQYWEFDGRE
jgi:hypothetical protein